MINVLARKLRLRASPRPLASLLRSSMTYGRHCPDCPVAWRSVCTVSRNREGNHHPRQFQIPSDDPSMIRQIPHFLLTETPPRQFAAKGASIIAPSGILSPAVSPICSAEESSSERYLPVEAMFQEDTVIPDTSDVKRNPSFQEKKFASEKSKKAGRQTGKTLGVAGLSATAKTHSPIERRTQARRELRSFAVKRLPFRQTCRP